CAQARRPTFALRGIRRMADDEANRVVVEAVGRTEVGQVREHNEDSYVMVRLDGASREEAVLAKHDLWVPGQPFVGCDGRGGAAAGEGASQMATESLAQSMWREGVPPAPDGIVDDEIQSLGRKLREAAREANGQIFREARQNLARSGMGTTMTAVL